jgi:hypothetical protein
MWTKLGFHAEKFTEAVKRWARVAPVIKAVGNVDILRYAKEHNPTCFTIYRPAIDQDQQDQWTPEAWAGKILQDLNGFKPDAVEYKNEWKQYLHEGFADRVEEEKKFVKLMHAHDIPVILLSGSVGSIEKEEVLHYKKHRWAGGDYLGLHCYWQRNKPNDVWTAHWYQSVHEWSGGKHPPMILTEVGIDDIDQMGAGWIAQGIPSHEYVGQLDLFDAKLPDYVKFATVFGAGPWPKWEKFDTDRIIDEILDKATAGTPIPNVWNKPAPIGGDPMEPDLYTRLLKDLWRRQLGREPQEDAFFNNALKTAKETNGQKIIIPIESPDGNYYTELEDGTIVGYLTLAYPMRVVKGQWDVVKAGFPPFQ